MVDKLRIFQGLFMGLRNVYGTYDVETGRVRQVKKPVTVQVLHNHLSGRRPYGVYPLVGDKTGALAVDFDDDDLSVPVAFVARAKRYELPAYIETSKSKGYHVWIFFERGGVSARKARLVARRILADMGRLQTEVFPKQDRLTDGVSYGNFINAPLFGKLVPKGRTVFVDPAQPDKPYPNQWELLAAVQRVSELKLDVLIKNYNLTGQSRATRGTKRRDRFRSSDEICSFGLPACSQRMLAQGVSSYQRVSCFRLAVHFKRCGMPYDQALTTLMAWAQRNRPEGGKRIITDREIESQTRDAFENNYRSLGCEDPAIAAYCDRNCPVHSHTRSKASPSTPCNQANSKSRNSNESRKEIDDEKL